MSAGAVSERRDGAAACAGACPGDWSDAELERATDGALKWLLSTYWLRLKVGEAAEAELDEARVAIWNLLLACEPAAAFVLRADVRPLAERGSQPVRSE